MGGTHAEVGLKPQLSPRGHAAKKEELNSHLTAAELWIYTAAAGFVNPAPEEHLNG